MNCALSPDDRAAFNARGYVRLREAFSPEVARQMQDRIWAELRADFGIEREDRGTWCQPGRDVRRAKSDPAHEAIATPRLTGAIDSLLGAGTWSIPRDWGRVLTTFPTMDPSEWTVPTDAWHWDCGLDENAAAPHRLLVFTYLSAVEPCGGGTQVVEGAHRLLQRFHAQLSSGDRALKHGELRNRFLRWDPWLTRLAGLAPGPRDRVTYYMRQGPRDVQGIPVQVVELVGRPGDAILCHPLLLHTPAPNSGSQPRFVRIRFLAQSALPAGTG